MDSVEVMDCALYLALGLGTAGVPRGFSSFRPGMSDIFLGLLGRFEGMAVATGSGALPCESELCNGRDRVWMVS